MPPLDGLGTLCSMRTLALLLVAKRGVVRQEETGHTLNSS